MARMAELDKRGNMRHKIKYFSILGFVFANLALQAESTRAEDGLHGAPGILEDGEIGHDGQQGSNGKSGGHGGNGGSSLYGNGGHGGHGGHAD
jgi:hypothetical protein